MVSAAKLKEIRKQFGNKLRQLRQERNWSQEMFAEECGLHRTYIGGVERGERNVSLDNIAKIAASLGVDVAALFKP